MAADGELHIDEIDTTYISCLKIGMLKDINVGEDDGSPASFTVVEDTMYFVANDGIHGNELWKTDGTLSGTVMVKDINTGSGDESTFA